MIIIRNLLKKSHSIWRLSQTVSSSNANINNPRTKLSSALLGTTSDEVKDTKINSLHHPTKKSANGNSNRNCKEILKFSKAGRNAIKELHLEDLLKKQNDRMMKDYRPNKQKKKRVRVYVDIYILNSLFGEF